MMMMMFKTLANFSPTHPDLPKSVELFFAPTLTAFPLANACANPSPSSIPTLPTPLPLGQVTPKAIQDTFLKLGHSVAKSAKPLKKTELIEEVIEVSDNPASMKCLCPTDQTYLRFPMTTQKTKMPGTVLCTYPGGKTSCKCTCKPFTIIEVDYTNLYPVVKRSADPQFIQNYQPGSQSPNFNCHFGGCGNIPGMQQFHGSHVINQGSNFNQDYFGGSHATNFGRKKRSPQFFQSFAPGSANVNCDAKGCGPAHLYPGTASLTTQFSNMMSNLNPFGQRPQQYPQQVQPGFMHFGDWPQFPQKPAASTIVE